MAHLGRDRGRNNRRPSCALLSLVDALMKGAIKGPVPPTNIVANDAIPPIPANDTHDDFIEPIFGPQTE